jgi:hypothetical protein
LSRPDLLYLVSEAKHLEELIQLLHTGHNGLVPGVNVSQHLLEDCDPQKKNISTVRKQENNFVCSLTSIKKSITLE